MFFIGPLIIQDLHYLCSRPEIFWTIFEPTAKKYFQIEIYLIIIACIMSTISLIYILADNDPNCFIVIFNFILAGITIYLCVLYILIMNSGEYVYDSG